MPRLNRNSLIAFFNLEGFWLNIKNWEINRTSRPTKSPEVLQISWNLETIRNDSETIPNIYLSCLSIPKLFRSPFIHSEVSWAFPTGRLEGGNSSCGPCKRNFEVMHNVFFEWFEWRFHWFSHSPPCQVVSTFPHGLPSSNITEVLWWRFFLDPAVVPKFFTCNLRQVLGRRGRSLLRNSCSEAGLKKKTNGYTCLANRLQSCRTKIMQDFPTKTFVGNDIFLTFVFEGVPRMKKHDNAPC